MAVGLRRRLLLSAALLAGTGVSAPCLAIRPETLDLPAVNSAAFRTAVLTAVGRAGIRLVAVGERGIVLLSDDAGLTWRQSRSVPVSATLTAVRFGTAQSGWVAGHAGVILHSVDGGETWSRQLDGETAAAIMLADTERMAPGPARDALLVAARQFVADGADKPFLDLVVDGDSILAVGAFGLALHSADAGQTWHSALDRFDEPAGMHLYHLTRAGRDEIVAGEQGLFMVAHGDGPFEKSEIPYGGTLFGVLSLPGGGLIAYGLHGTLLHAAGLGQNWTQTPTGLNDGLVRGLVLADGRIVVASAGGQMIVSGDGGRSVRPVPGPHGPIADMAEMDGTLVLVGARGPWRLPISAL